MWCTTDQWVVVVVMVVVVVLPCIATTSPGNPHSAWTHSHAHAPPDPQARIIEDTPSPHVPQSPIVSLNWVGAGVALSPSYLPQPPHPALQLPHWVPDYKAVKDVYWGNILDALHIAGHHPLPQSPLQQPPLQQSPLQLSHLSQSHVTPTLQTVWRPVTSTTRATITPRATHNPEDINSLDDLPLGTPKPPREIAQEILDATHYDLLNYLKERPPPGAAGTENRRSDRRGDVHQPWPSVDLKQVPKLDKGVREIVPKQDLAAGTSWWWRNRNSPVKESWMPVREVNPMSITSRLTGSSQSITAMPRPLNQPPGSLSPSNALQDLSADGLGTSDPKEGLTHAWLHAIVQNDLKNWGYPYDHTALQHLPPRYGFPWPASKEPMRPHRPAKGGASAGTRPSHDFSVPQKLRQDTPVLVKSTSVPHSKSGGFPSLSFFQQSSPAHSNTLPNPTRGPDWRAPTQTIPKPSGTFHSYLRSSSQRPASSPVRKDITPLHAILQDFSASHHQERQATPRYPPPHALMQAPQEVPQMSKTVSPEPRQLTGFGPPKGHDIMEGDEGSSTTTTATDSVQLSEYAVQDLPQEVQSTDPQQSTPADGFLTQPRPDSITNTAPQPSQQSYPRPDTITFTAPEPPQQSYNTPQQLTYSTQAPATTTSYTTPSTTTTTTEAANKTGPTYIPWPNPKPGAGPLRLPRLPFFDRPLQRPAPPNLNFLNPFNLFRARENPNSMDTFSFLFPFSSSPSQFYKASDSEPSPSLPSFIHHNPSVHLTPPPPGTKAHTAHTKPLNIKTTFVKLPRGLLPSARPTIMTDTHTKLQSALKVAHSPAKQITRAPRQWPVNKETLTSRPISFQPFTTAPWIPITTEPVCESQDHSASQSTGPQTKPATHNGDFQHAKRSPKNTHLHVVPGVPVAVMKEVLPQGTTHHQREVHHSSSTNPPQNLPSSTLLPPPLATQTSKIHTQVLLPPPPPAPADIDFPMPKLIKFTIADVIRTSSRPTSQPQMKPEPQDTKHPSDLSLSSSEQMVTVAKFQGIPTEGPMAVNEKVIGESTGRNTMGTSSIADSPSPFTTPPFTTMSMSSSRMMPLITTPSPPLNTTTKPRRTTPTITSHPFLFPSNWKITQPPGASTGRGQDGKGRKREVREGDKSQEQRNRDRNTRVSAATHTQNNHTFPRTTSVSFNLSTRSSTTSSSYSKSSPTSPATRQKVETPRNVPKTTTARSRNNPPVLFKQIMMPGKVNHRSIQAPQQIQARPSSTANSTPQRKLRYTTHRTKQVQQTTTRPFSSGRSTAVVIPVEKTGVKIDTHGVQPNPSTSTSTTENGHTSKQFSPSKEDTKTSNPFTVISFSASKEPKRHPFATTSLAVSKEISAHRITPATPLPTTAQSHTRQDEENTENGEERVKLEKDEEQEEVEEIKEEVVPSKEVREERTWSEEIDANELTTATSESPETTTPMPNKRVSSIQRIRNFMARKRAQMRATTTTTTATTTTTTTTTPTPTTTTEAAPQQATARRKTNARRFPATTKQPFTFSRRARTTAPHTTTPPPTTKINTTHKSQDSVPESSQTLHTEERVLKDFPDLKDFLHWESTRLRPEKDSGDEDFIPEGTSVSYVSVVPPGGVRGIFGPRMIKNTQEKVLVSPTYASVGWSTPYKTMDREKTNEERLTDKQTHRQTDAATTYPS